MAVDPAPEGYSIKERQRIIEKLKRGIEYKGGPLHISFVPGRVNITEYMDMLRSRQVSFTVQRGIWSMSTGRQDRMIKIILKAFDTGEMIDLDPYIRYMKKAGRDMSWKDFIWENPCFLRKAGDPVNYVLSPVLRYLFNRAHDSKIRGYDMIIDSGDLPAEAGLSSSSSIVVSSGMHFISYNGGFAGQNRDNAEILGESEWYAGTRGGANDHATIIRGRRGSILINDHRENRIRTDFIKTGNDYDMYLLNSLLKAGKSKNAKKRFNEIRNSFIDAGRQCSAYHKKGKDMEIGEFTYRELKECMENLKGSGKVRAVLEYYLNQMTFIEKFESEGIIRGKDIYSLHWNLSMNLKNSNEFIDSLIRTMEDHFKGISGAKITGAGFGGCILLISEKSADVKGYVRDIYRRKEIISSFRQAVRAQVYSNSEQRELMGFYEQSSRNPDIILKKIRISDGAAFFRL